MPSIKDFENKANKKTSEDDSLDLETKSKKSRSPRRRPGRDEAEEVSSEENTVKAETAEEAAEAFDSFNPTHLEADHETLREMEQETASASEEKKESPFKTIHVKLMGKDLLTIETPEKLVELADTVVEDWKNDGPFEALPVGNPIAQLVAAKGLRKAKDLEKKLEEKGVFAMAQMGLAVIKSKLKK